MLRRIALRCESARRDRGPSPSVAALRRTPALGMRRPAAERPRQGSAFTLQGTHGYEIDALVASIREGDAGQLVLFVGRKGGSAIYVVARRR